MSRIILFCLFVIFFISCINVDDQTPVQFIPVVDTSLENTVYITDTLIERDVDTIILSDTIIQIDTFFDTDTIVRVDTLVQADTTVAMEETRRPIRYLALGDSYTIGQGLPADSSFPGQLYSALGAMGHDTIDMSIIARTGWRTDVLSNNIEFLNPDSTQSLVTLLIGVNDQFQRVPIDRYPINFTSLLEESIALAQGVVDNVIVLSIPDYGFTPFGRGNQAVISADIDAYNAINQDISEQMGVRYVNITGISRLGLLRPTLVVDDNLHPSAEQYALWVERILADF